mmetsp:Transcript_4147/g.10004  ORF Transcript_4147/g.10004 Transcript_4147/m.10004 type:complete len:243 (+) Transcript_4147:677-1405(+)
MRVECRPFVITLTHSGAARVPSVQEVIGLRGARCGVRLRVREVAQPDKVANLTISLRVHDLQNFSAQLRGTAVHHPSMECVRTHHRTRGVLSRRARAGRTAEGGELQQGLRAVCFRHQVNEANSFHRALSDQHRRELTRVFRETQAGVQLNHGVTRQLQQRGCGIELRHGVFALDCQLDLLLEVGPECQRRGREDRQVQALNAYRCKVPAILLIEVLSKHADQYDHNMPEATEENRPNARHD